MRPGQLAQPVTQPRLVVRPNWSRATLGGAMLPGDPTGATLRDPEALPQGHHGPAAPLRGQKFPSASSLSMSMSSAWLATSRFNRAFSASSSLEPLGLAGLHPAVAARHRFQVASLLSNLRRTSARSLPSLSSRSPSRTFRTACSGCAGVASRDRPPAHSLGYRTLTTGGPTSGAHVTTAPALRGRRPRPPPPACARTAR